MGGCILLLRSLFKERKGSESKYKKKKKSKKKKKKWRERERDKGMDFGANINNNEVYLIQIIIVHQSRCLFFFLFSVLCDYLYMRVIITRGGQLNSTRLSFHHPKKRNTILNILLIC